MEKATSKKEALSKTSLVVSLVDQYNRTPAKADEIVLNRHLYTGQTRQSLRTCQFIFLAVLRNKSLIDKAINSFANKKPRPQLFSLLECASAELIDCKEDASPKIIHFWVEEAKRIFSKSEANFCNALLRKIFTFLLEAKENAKTFEEISEFLSHPLWLAKRWETFFGKDEAIRIMRLNQEPSGVYFRLSPTQAALEKFKALAEYFEILDTQNSDNSKDACAEFLPADMFSDFYKMKSGSWESASALMENNLAYIQDPSTAYAPNLLNPQAGQKILDLCAAPGGKSRFILDLLKKSSDTSEKLKDTLLVSVDTGAKRLVKLKENLYLENSIRCEVLDCNLLKENLSQKLAEKNLPESFDAILLDAPCSNSGVLGRRPDARYRLKEEDITACAALQLSLLKEAKKYLKQGGRLVYSTCSIDPEENESVIENFLKDAPDFKLLCGATRLPTAFSDGCGTFLLQRK